ncbi:MAG: tryptophan synthase subunit alpha [Candidatus Hydrogenedentota bacterium]
MNRIEARFQELRTAGKKAFIPYITAGDPTLDRTAEFVIALEQAGADVIELGIPFSDPLADGVVNQEAAMRALRHNISLRDVIGMVKKVREQTEVPIVLFTYFNPVYAYGIERFGPDCQDAGVDGVLCVDLPPEEAKDYKACLDAQDIATIFLLAPTSTEKRIEAVSKQSRGFVYYVSRTGVTGEQAQVERDVGDMVAKIKSHTDKPVAVGFGISKPEHATEIARYADGVIVGSAIVRMIGKLGDSPETATKVAAFVESLVKAAKQA